MRRYGSIENLTLSLIRLSTDWMWPRRPHFDVVCVYCSWTPKADKDKQSGQHCSRCQNAAWTPNNNKHKQTKIDNRIGMICLSVLTFWVVSKLKIWMLHNNKYKQTSYGFGPPKCIQRLWICFVKHISVFQKHIRCKMFTLINYHLANTGAVVV